MSLLADLNWIAIVVGAIVSFALGWLWYGPLFGNAWMEELGKKPEDLDGGAKPFIISAVLVLITSFVMAVLVACLGIKTWSDGAILGVAVGIGLVATSYFSDASFSGKSNKLTAIESGYRVVYLIILGVLFGLWQ